MNPHDKQYRETQRLTASQRVDVPCCVCLEAEWRQDSNVEVGAHSKLSCKFEKQARNHSIVATTCMKELWQKNHRIPKIQDKMPILPLGCSAPTVSAAVMASSEASLSLL